MKPHQSKPMKIIFNSIAIQIAPATYFQHNRYSLLQPFHLVNRPPLALDSVLLPGVTQYCYFNYPNISQSSYHFLLLQ
jgi:hypothetical protein